MRNTCQTYLLSVIFLLMCCLLVFYAQTVEAQTKPLTYAEITTALNNIQNNRQGKSTTKDEAIALVISEVKSRGIDETFSAEIETNLRKLGATDELIEAIEQNSPPFRIKTTKEYDAYIKRGDKCFDKKGDVWIDFYNSVIADYTKAIELTPNYYLAYYKRGLCRSTLSEQGINSPSGVYKAFFDKMKEQFNQSIDDFGKAIELNSKFANAYFERGKVYTKIPFNGDPDKFHYAAVADFTKVIELKPKFAEAYYRRAELYLTNYVNYSHLFKPDLAIADLSKIINELKDSYYYRYALISRAKIYHKKKEYDLAISDFDTVIKDSYTDKVGLYMQRGLAYEEKGDYQKAIADYQKELQLNSTSKEAKDALTRVTKLAKP